MTNVRVVTDSTADIPADLANELDITVVPLNVHIGDEVFLDGVDIQAEEFFRRLAGAKALPTTSQPSAGVFERTYRQIAQTNPDIVSIHISSKLSGTLQSASLARNTVRDSAHVEVIDSLAASMPLEMIVIHAAREAKKGRPLNEVAAFTRAIVPQVSLMFFVDTLEYLQKGGRIGKAQAFMGTLLNVKPLLTLRDGEVFPVDRVRTRGKAVERLYEFVADFPHVEEIGVLDSAGTPETEAFIERLSAFYPKEKVLRAHYGPVLGVHLGPNTLGVAVYEGLPKGSRLG